MLFTMLNLKGIFLIFIFIFTCKEGNVPLYEQKHIIPCTGCNEYKNSGGRLCGDHHAAIFSQISMGVNILYIYTIWLHQSRTRALTSCPSGQDIITMHFYYFKNIYGSKEDFQILNTFYCMTILSYVAPPVALRGALVLQITFSYNRYASYYK